MKLRLILLAFFCVLCAANDLQAQTTAKEFIKTATLKQGLQDDKGAIDDYTKALSLDSTLIQVYVNRGTCYMRMGKMQQAREDFLDYLERDSMYLDMYYSIAVTFLSEQNHASALPYLERAIAINPEYPPNRNMRGQILNYLGYKVSGCSDFQFTKDRGDKEGADLYQKLCLNKWDSSEAFSLDWPVGEKWHIQSSVEDSTYSLMEFLKEGESPDTWTEYGAMLTVREIEGTNLDGFANVILQEFKSRAPKAKMRVIEKNLNEKYPWIILALEAPKTTNHLFPESQLWYIVQGKETMYGNFRAVKSKTLKKELIKKWSAFFKTGKIVGKE